MYHGNGECEWELKNKENGTTLVSDSDGQQLSLENRVPFDLQAVCVVNGTVPLNVTISITGKSVGYFNEAIHVRTYLSLQTQFHLQ